MTFDHFHELIIEISLSHKDAKHYNLLESDRAKDSFLIEILNKGKLRREDVIGLMLTEEGKNYFRGTVTGKKYGFCL